MMKKLFVFTLAVCVILSTVAFAQYGSNPPAQKDQADQATKNIKGTVKAEGDKVTLIADQDQKSWNVDNPDALKGHEGHHVQVTAQVDADKGSLHVTEVKMLGSSKAGDETK